MTYTTEEKQKIAELRHKSKMNTLNLIAVAEGDYNKATATSIIRQAHSEIEKSKAIRALANKRIAQIKWWSL